MLAASVAAAGVRITSSGLPDCDSKMIGLADDIPETEGRMNRSAKVCEFNWKVTGPLIPFTFMASMAALILVKSKVPVPMV